MHLEAADKTVQTKPAPPSSSSIHQEVHNTWGPRLGATANSTFNQSYAHQYDDVAQATVNSVKHGIEHLLGTMMLVGDAVKDVAEVATKDARIQIEKVTDPARANLHEAELSKRLHELGHNYEPVVQAAKHAHATMERNLEDIGAKAEHDPRQYARLITEPANAIGKAIDRFTGQSPAAQIDAIGDQITQIAGTGLLGKAAEAAGGALRLTEAAAKFDALFAKMEQTKLTFGPNGLKLEGSLVSDGANAPEHVAFSKGSIDGKNGFEKSLPIDSETPRYLERLPVRVRDDDPTEGILVAGGHDLHLRSGYSGPTKDIPIPLKGWGYNNVVRSHVEAHCAAFMKQNGIKEGRVYINHHQVCAPCQQYLPRMLEEGSTLDVVTSDGKVHRFIGEAKKCK